MDINGVSAIVTGGASGLGAATARVLTEAGARVAIFDVNQELAEATASEIGGHAVVCDVTDAAGTEAAIANAREAIGASRILINCAGVGTPAKAVGRKGPLPLERFAQVVAINLIGTFNVIRLAAADMIALEPLKDGERGVIVNTASVAAFDGQIGQPAYAASKAGVVGMTLPLAREFAEHGIRVLTIAPGIFETPMLHGLDEKVQQSLAAMIPFPSRLGTAEEFAGLAKHMCENMMLNGEVVRLDGAIRMAPR
jgi:NAD(P)-dependent dehydrogenase (short-subunit alcohol dehydrogenase family)